MHIHDHKILIKKNGLLTWKLQNQSGFFVRYPLRILKEWGDYPVSPKTSQNWSKKRPMTWMTLRFLLSGRPSPNQPARKRTGLGRTWDGCPFQPKQTKSMGQWASNRGPVLGNSNQQLALISVWSNHIEGISAFPHQTFERKSACHLLRGAKIEKKTVNHQKQEILKIIQCI